MVFATLHLGQLGLGNFDPIEAAEAPIMSAAIFVEASIVIETRFGAYSRFGKGRHRAGLNYGDCFSYALATVLGEPLLYKGEDFRQTEITPFVPLPHS